jgi:hypothetical protein
LNKIWVYLTEGEARALAVQLSTLFDDDQRPNEWHSHFESDDGRAKELTLALYDPDAQTGDLAVAGLVQGGSMGFGHVQRWPDPIAVCRYVRCLQAVASGGHPKIDGPYRALSFRFMLNAEKTAEMLVCLRAWSS